MGSSIRMKTFLGVLATTLFAQCVSPLYGFRFAQNLGNMEGSMDDANYNCPMIGIDLYGHDLDTFYGIGSWQECAHICNIACNSNCKFWTYYPSPTSPWYQSCYLKSSDAGMMPNSDTFSGQRGCTK